MKRLPFALALVALTGLSANPQDNGKKRKDTMVRKAGNVPPTSVNQSKPKSSSGDNGKAPSSSQTKGKKLPGRTKSDQGNQ